MKTKSAGQMQVVLPRQSAPLKRDRILVLDEAAATAQVLPRLHRMHAQVITVARAQSSSSVIR